ncbi:MAG: GGDEF domain-containing protein [Lachnospiraceae bacterium]|nr:GGDEF domain-containing protein [Lachnospiraceae bacterium]MBQ1173385.1 GGDEF domain-containing protein [Lachnospiraceae bacterium]
MDGLRQLFQNMQSILTGEKTVSELDKYRFISVVLAFIHIALCICFYLYEYPILFIYNIFAVILYLIMGFRFTALREYALMYYCCYAEITFFSSFATLLAGWDWGFMIYLIALTPVSFYLAYSSPQFGHGIKKPFFFVSLSMVVFVITRILSTRITPLYTERIFDQHMTLMYSVNAIVSFFALLLFSILFTIEIRQNEIRLEEQYSLLESVSSKDPLTGLFNRRSMDKYLITALEQAKGDGLVFSVILGDIDDFKRVNDTYGHNIGDQVLMQVAKTISENASEGCRVCRWGGEEILIFIPENETVTYEVAEKIRQSIEQIRVPFSADYVSVTMTFGIAEYSPGLPFNKLVSIADNRLYYGKRHGKNQVVSTMPDEQTH